MSSSQSTSQRAPVVEIDDGRQVVQLEVATLDYQAACEVLDLDRTITEDIDMTCVPSRKRRKFEQRVIDLAVDADLKRQMEDAGVQGHSVIDIKGKTVGTAIARRRSGVAWQLMIVEADGDDGAVWYDLSDTWCSLLEERYKLTEDWMDAMWDRQAGTNGLPVVWGGCAGTPWLYIKLHKHGATQVNSMTGTRRPVRRVAVEMGHGNAMIVDNGNSNTTG